MNDVIRTIKSDDAKIGVCGNCGPVRDPLHVCDVKPDTEPDWTTALVIRDASGALWRQEWTHDRVWVRLSTPLFDGLKYDNDLQNRSPLTVIIDKDGRNVEAEERELDAWVSDTRQMQEKLNEAIRAREIAQRDLRKLQRKHESEGDEWEAMYNEVRDELEAEQARNRVYRKITEAKIQRLEADNARFQAQVGDGR